MTDSPDAATLSAPALTPLALENAPLLRALAAQDFATQVELADRLGRDKSNLAKTLKRLAGEGLVDGTTLTSAGANAVRDLDKLVGSTSAPAAGDSPFLLLRHDQISPDPENARKHFDQAAIAELAETMFTHGLKQKPAVRREPIDGKHPLTMGERRWRAWGLLIQEGRWPASHTEPCWIDQAPDEGARAEGSLIENLQREDLNHMEIGEAFEVLADRYGRSNKEIAERVGCSPEYVQQHRRLTKLEAEDQEGVRSGRWSMHDALRILANPKPDPLTPAELLVFAEIVAKSADKPLNRYSHGTECSYLAEKDPTLQALCKRNVAQYGEDWNTHKSTVSRAWGASDLLRSLKPLTDGPAPRAKLLLELRTAVVGADEAAALAKSGRYVTPYLNGPFELSEKQRKAIEADKARRAKEKDQAKAAKTKREQALADFRALDEGLRRSHAGRALDARLPIMLKAAEIKLPLELKNGRVVDAAGMAAFDVNWRFAERGEGLNLLLATIVNAACGYGAAAPAEAEEAAQ